MNFVVRSSISEILSDVSSKDVAYPSTLVRLCASAAKDGAIRRRFLNAILGYTTISLVVFGVAKSAFGAEISTDDFARLAMRCAPSIPVKTLLAVARTESALDPSALHDNTTGVTETPGSVSIAFNDASSWIGRGDSVDVGLMQVNSANLSALGMNLRSALDPCASLAGGAAVLQAAYGGGNTSADQQAALLMALSRYNTGSPWKGIMNGYARTVMANADIARLPVPAGAIPPGPPRDPNAPPAWNISATGAYAQNHGAAWLVPLSDPANEASIAGRISPSDPVRVAAKEAGSSTQNITRSP